MCPLDVSLDLMKLHWSIPDAQCRKAVFPSVMERFNYTGDFLLLCCFIILAETPLRYLCFVHLGAVACQPGYGQDQPRDGMGYLRSIKAIHCLHGLHYFAQLLVLLDIKLFEYGSTLFPVLDGYLFSGT